MSFRDTQSDEVIEGYMLQKLFDDMSERLTDEELRTMAREFGVKPLRYSRQAIESSLTRLWEDGMDTDDVAYVVSRVKEDLDGQTDHPEREKEVIEEMASAHGDDAREEETESARRADMLHRLQCTAAIPSSTDVINGFRQWYSVTTDDVFSFPTHDS